MAIDLHAHSTASDGTEKPSAIVKMAVDRGLTALALTDHDTLDGIGDARRAAQRQHPGVDLGYRTVIAIRRRRDAPGGAVARTQPGARCKTAFLTSS